MDKKELLDLINECGGDTSVVTNRTRVGLLKALAKVLSEQPEPTEPTIVPVAENVPYAAGEAPTKEEFDALIDALIECGLMEEPEPEPDPGE